MLDFRQLREEWTSSCGTFAGKRSANFQCLLKTVSLGSAGEASDLKQSEKETDRSAPEAVRAAGYALVPAAFLTLLTCNPSPAVATDTVRVLTEYDARGQVERSSQPHRLGDAIRWTEHRYDGLDRPVRLIRPDGTSVQTRYGTGPGFSSVETRDELGQ